VEERAAAGLLLSQIILLRRTVDEMNAARDLAVAGKTGVARMRALNRVTPSGEFLSAHRRGLCTPSTPGLTSGRISRLPSIGRRTRKTANP